MKKKLEKSEFSDKFNKIYNQNLERVESEALEDLWSISDPNVMQSNPPGYQIPPEEDILSDLFIKPWKRSVRQIVLESFTQHGEDRVVSEIIIGVLSMLYPYLEKIDPMRDVLPWTPYQI